MTRKFILILLVFMCSSAFIYAQRTITGKVIDIDSGPLPGATISVENTSQGVTTDIDGNFKISVSDGAVLIVSYVGFKPNKVKIGIENNYIIVLELDNALETVVINALGFTENRDKQGSTSSVVKTADVLRSGEATIINSLSGKASGVKINFSNGDPGAGSSIRIRGANTILGASDPLIIVDGVPLNNTTSYAGGYGLNGARSDGITQQSRFNDINPDDIASIVVLKGASAAAIWGSRASNGVIVIVTKKGRSGKAKITYSSSYSFDKVSERYPNAKYLGSGTQWVFWCNSTGILGRLYTRSYWRNRHF